MSTIEIYENLKSSNLDLHSACRVGSLEIIKKAFKSSPQKLNSKDTEVTYKQLGWAPLYRTVICGDLESTEYLLKQGADPNVTNSIGETPLHQAADNSFLEIARLLLDYKADPNAQQTDGDSPLHHAAFRGDSRMVSLLLESGANPNLTNFLFGRSPLHYAVSSDSCVKILFDYGADPNLIDKQGKSFLNGGCSEEILLVLNRTRTAEEVNDIFTNSFNRRPSDLTPSQNATNFISDVGGESGMFDTFGIEKMQKSTKYQELKPIFNWLKEINLEELYEIMCDAGYDDVKAMVSQMTGPLPITASDLKDSGIKKLGHRMRIVAKLKQDAGIMPELKSKKTSDNSSFLHCCLTPNNATRNTQISSLAEWLDSISAGVYYSNFSENGFDDYESLLMLKSEFDFKFLEENLGIKNKEIRGKILKKLEKDLEKYYSSSVNVSFDEEKIVACEPCISF